MHVPRYVDDLSRVDEIEVESTLRRRPDAIRRFSVKHSLVESKCLAVVFYTLLINRIEEIFKTLKLPLEVVNIEFTICSCLSHVIFPSELHQSGRQRSEPRLH